MTTVRIEPCSTKMGEVVESLYGVVEQISKDTNQITRPLCSTMLNDSFWGVLAEFAADMCDEIREHDMKVDANFIIRTFWNRHHWETGRCRGGWALGCLILHPLHFPEVSAVIPMLFHAEQHGISFFLPKTSFWPRPKIAFGSLHSSILGFRLSLRFWSGGYKCKKYFFWIFSAR